MTRKRFFTTVVMMTALLATNRSQAQDKGEGPATLVLSYKSAPSNRTAFHAYMESAGVTRFEAWKKQGVFAGYQVLFSSYVNDSTWDALLVLSFDKYVDQARWKEIERKEPGGLDAAGLALASPKNAYVADLTWSGAAEKRGETKPVYFVIPYTYLVGRADYKTYVDGYVIPQMKGWVSEGVVSSYRIFLNQNETGDPWDALFILEYRDLRALALRRATITKVRAVLANNPVWKKLSDDKHEVRKEGEIIIADEVRLK